MLSAAASEIGYRVAMKATNRGAGRRPCIDPVESLDEGCGVR